MMNERYDVVVAGAGSAGIVAAVQAARAGAKTLLVEKNARLGGVTVNSGINYPGLFHAWGKQLIRGIGWELVARTVEESGSELPDFSVPPARHFRHQVRVDMMVYAALADELVVTSGAELLLHAMPAKVEPAADGWTLTICTKEGLVDVQAAVLIDCTGDANLTAMAGHELRRPDYAQPATLSCYATGYDLEAIDMESLNEAFIDAIARGEVKASDGCWRTDTPSIGHWLHTHGQNGNHIEASAEGRTSRGRSQLEVEGRRAIYRIYRFLQGRPGFENLQIDWVSPEIGIRETVTIVGEDMVTVEDFESGRMWPEALTYSFYPIDLHGMDTQTWQAWPLPEGVIGTIPRGAMVPAGSRNFLVAGRPFSSDRLANSAMRVQASCMAMGQAAGAMAALAADMGTTVKELDLETVRELLRTHDAIVPPDDPPAA